MAQNKIKYTFQNIKNIVDHGNQQLIQFERKQYVIKKGCNSQEYKNRLQLDENGQLYIKNKQKGLHFFDKQKYGLMPNWCPKCGRIMGKKQLDQTYWNIHQMCMDCAISYQGQMKINGTWPQFVLTFMMNKLISFCDQATDFYYQVKNQTKKEVVLNDYGDTQQWSLQSPEQFIDIVNKIIEQIVQFKQQALLYFQEQILNAKEQQKKAQIDIIE